MSIGDQGYTIPLDGSRYLMQPPFTPAGVVINNRTDRIVALQDGRGWSRSVRPGAVGRFSIDRPDSNYIGQLASAGTQGECRVTFTQSPIVETGEPAAEGPRTVIEINTVLDGSNVEELVDCTAGRVATLTALAIGADAGLAVNEMVTFAGVTYSLELTCEAELTLIVNRRVQVQFGEGLALPLPPTLVLHRNSGTIGIRFRLGT